MKKVKLLSLLLALLMLAGSAVLFSSCKKDTDGVVTLSRKTVRVDLTGYTLVYGDSQSDAEYTATFRDQLNLLADNLNAATGEKFSPYTVARTKTGAADKEILIGMTGRTESTEAFAEIEGEGFAITVTDNKIVIVGTSNLFTLMGMSYFTEKYLSGAEKSKELLFHESAMANDVGTLTLATSAETEYTYVYKDGLGTLPRTLPPLHIRNIRR